MQHNDHICPFYGLTHQINVLHCNWASLTYQVEKCLVRTPGDYGPEIGLLLREVCY